MAVSKRAELQLEGRVLQDRGARSAALGKEAKEIAALAQEKVCDGERGRAVHARHAVHEHATAFSVHFADEGCRCRKALFEQRKGTVVLSVER